FSKKIEIKNFLDFTSNITITKIFVHFLTSVSVALVNILKTKQMFKTYWVFFGADMYKLLSDNNKIQLLDQKKSIDYSIIKILQYFYFNIKYVFFFKNRQMNIINKFIKELDYFCFWNFD